MNSSTHSILRVERFWKTAVKSPIQFLGSAIYLGGQYAITCFHVLVPEGQKRDEDYSTLTQNLDTYEYRFLTEDGSQFAVLRHVRGEKRRGEGDFALLELDVCARTAVQPVPLKLLSNVPGKFLDEPGDGEAFQLGDCEGVAGCGFPGEAGGTRFERHPVDTTRRQNFSVNNAGLLTDWQLTQGSIKEGFSGGAIIAQSGQQVACLGMLYLGGEGAATSRVTVSNQIIEFLRPVLRQDELDAMLIESKELLSQTVPASIEGYRQHGLKRWNERFYEGPFDAKEQRTGFIETQGLKLLDPRAEPREWLKPEYFRSRRTGIPEAQPQVSAVDEAWATMDRSDLVRGIIELPDGRSYELNRMVVVTDAGVGKTTNLFWLATQFNQDPTDRVAFLVDPAAWQLIDKADNWLKSLLNLLLSSVGDPGTEAQQLRLERYLRRKRDEGKLVILLDGLDHANPDQVTAIKRLLDDATWSGCRVIIGGRPHALQRHWNELFPASQPWRFVQAEEFTPDEQDRYLGDFPDGTKRYSKIPPEARSILGVPRVLELLKELKDSELTELRTASDVYWKATRRLIIRGLKESAAARQLGGGLSDSDQIGLAIELLAAIAFQMTSDRLLVESPKSGNGGDGGNGLSTEKHFQPNFDKILPDCYPEFRGSVWERVKDSDWYSRKPFQDFTNDLNCLAAMNTVLSHGFFDSDTNSGLNGVLWRNRSLQEFFTAVWLSRHFTCADDYSDEDGEQLRSWVFTPDDLASEAYYEVWRYAAEMPAAGRVGKCWVRAMGVLYLPGDGTEATRRSNEMLYRSWSTMESYAEGIPDTKAIEQAEKVLAGFQGELENTILARKRGETLREHAQEFLGSFVELTGDSEFRMGSPEEKQGRMPEASRKFWEEWLAQGHNDREAHVEQLLDRLPIPPGKAGARQRAEDYEFYFRVHRDRDLNAIRRLFYCADETPAQPVQSVAGFHLSHSPALNRWYRLYDPGHGLRFTEYGDRYGTISETDDCPVIYVSWYDAWAFCRWAYWEGLSCRLPSELEWEYAAKAGCRWDWDYWWHETDYDPKLCNGNRQAGKTLPPAAARANPFGLRDMLGNVLEWCADWYRRQYSWEATSARVLRGGSWRGDPALCRSAFRYGFAPADRNDYVGFRVARAASRKS